jgi:hypothetical protein
VRRAAAIGCALLAASCTQILGLDNTKPPIDAAPIPIDAADVCAETQTSCTGSGRQVCGQLLATGATAGTPVRATAPTGSVCAPPTGSDSGSGSDASGGPCAFTVTGGSIDQLAGGSGLVAGSIDDCGRFAVDLDPSLADVVVVFEGAGYARTARAVLARPAMTGEDTVTGLAVTTDTETAWSQQLVTAGSGSGSGSGMTAPPDTTSGFLVQYTADDLPLGGEAAASNGSSPFSNAPGKTPWAAYFTGAFDAMDPTATYTGSAGAAFVVTGEGSAQSLEGFRTGKRCKAANMRQVSGVLVFVVETDC